MSVMKIYQNKGGEIRWDGRQSALYDSEREPGGCVKRLEFLREDDPRYRHVAEHRTIELVDKMPPCDDIEELRAFVIRGNFKPEWIAGWMERLIAESARAEADQKAKEEVKLSRNASKSGDNPPDKKSQRGSNAVLKLIDPEAAAIINNSELNTKEKYIALRAHDTKFQGYSNVQMGELLGVTGQRITQIRNKTNSDAAKLKKERDNRHEEEIVDDRNDPRMRPKR